MLKCGKFIRFIAVVGLTAVAGVVLYKIFFEEKLDNKGTKKASDSDTKESFKKSLREYVPITFDGLSKSKQKEDLDIIFSGEENLKSKVSNGPKSSTTSESVEENSETASASYFNPDTGKDSIEDDDMDTVTTAITDAVVEDDSAEDISSNLT